MFWASLLVSCSLFDRKNKAYEREREAEIVGTYRIYTLNSRLGNYKGSLKDWEATFSPDKKFTFSRKLPFFLDSVGTWRYVFRNDVAYMLISYNVGSNDQVLTDTNKLMFQYPEPSSGNAAEEVILIKK